MSVVVDYAAALEVVEDWLDMLEQLRATDDDFTTTAAQVESIDDWFVERCSLIRRIGESFGYQPASWSRFTQGNPRPWRATRDVTLQLRGQLAHHEQARRVFPDPPGPSLTASDLHEVVWDAAHRLWSDGHPRLAVGNSATAVDVMLQAKVGREDVSGAKLVGEAFSLSPPAPGRPRLRFPEIADETSERWRSAHAGALDFGRGCFEGIRNWAAHTLEDAEKQIALEYLAALSVLARWIDRAVICTSDD